MKRLPRARPIQAKIETPTSISAHTEWPCRSKPSERRGLLGGSSVPLRRQLVRPQSNQKVRRPLAISARL